jgi:hypothetical protein
MMQNKQPIREDVYRDFVRWFAMSYLEKKEFGIMNQLEFAEKFEVSKDTLSRWKVRPDFESEVDKHTSTWARGKLPDIYHSIYQSAVRGNARSQKLWLEHFKEFPAKKKGAKSTDEKPPAVISEDDVRYIISFLPEWRQVKYNDMLRDLYLDGELFIRGDGVNGMTEEEYNEYQNTAL